MRQTSSAVVCTLVMVTVLFASAVRADTDGAAGFIDALSGNWSGRATVTPVGERPYDIRFQLTPDGHLEGNTSPGASIHYWSFRRVDDGLALRFLSTFRGNTTPVWLDAEAGSSTTVEFQARQPRFLRVAISVREETAIIKVLHHGRLHVEIQLLRR